MTMMPIWKTCPRCHRKYDWNPDVGVRTCPYCMKKNQKRLKKIKSLLKN